MKRFLCISLVFFCQMASADLIKEPYIDVIGSANQAVVPDVIHWSVKVNHHGYKLDVVAKQHQTLVGKVVAQLQKKSLKKQSLQTTNMQFGEKTKYQQNNRVNDGYFATTHIHFTLKDLTQYQAIWQLLADIKEVSVTNTQFDYSKSHDVAETLRLKALVNARNKAEKMASALNVSIGDPIAISEVNNNHTPQRARAQAFLAESDTSNNNSLSLGELMISAKVKVSFKIVNEINIHYNR